MGECMRNRTEELDHHAQVTKHKWLEFTKPMISMAVVLNKATILYTIYSNGSSKAEQNIASSKM